MQELPAENVQKSAEIKNYYLRLSEIAYQLRLSAFRKELKPGLSQKIIKVIEDSLNNPDYQEPDYFFITSDKTDLMLEKTFMLKLLWAAMNNKQQPTFSNIAYRIIQSAVNACQPASRDASFNAELSAAEVKTIIEKAITGGIEKAVFNQSIRQRRPGSVEPTT